LLASELQGLLDFQFDDIELTGFSLGEIDLMLDEPVEKKAAQPAAEDELLASSRQAPAVSQAGDLWFLGPHRLSCGDAPLDCDVIVRHWQQHTGKAARLAGSALTFAGVAATRRAAQNASSALGRGK
jgi:hypothetical protein